MADRRDDDTGGDTVAYGSPFVLVEGWVVELLCAADAPPSTPAVYLVLGSFVGNVDRTCWPSRETIAARTRKSVDTVDRCIGYMAGVGVLSVVPRLTSTGGRRSNQYVLHRHPTIAARGGRMGAAPVDNSGGGAAPVRLGGPHGRGPELEQEELQPTPVAATTSTPPADVGVMEVEQVIEAAVEAVLAGKADRGETIHAPQKLAATLRRTFRTTAEERDVAGWLTRYDAPLDVFVGALVSGETRNLGYYRR